MTLQKHDREVHPNESQELVCHVCGFSTMRKRLMSVHFARKHDPEKQKKVWNIWFLFPLIPSKQGKNIQTAAT